MIARGFGNDTRDVREGPGRFAELAGQVRPRVDPRGCVLSPGRNGFRPLLARVGPARKNAARRIPSRATLGRGVTDTLRTTPDLENARPRFDYANIRAASSSVRSSVVVVL